MGKLVWVLIKQSKIFSANDKKNNGDMVNN